MNTVVVLRDDNYNPIASFSLTDGVLDEESLEGCLLTKMDGLPDGSGLNFRLDLSEHVSKLSGVPSEDLIEELRSRLKDN